MKTHSTLRVLRPLRRGLLVLLFARLATPPTLAPSQMPPPPDGLDPGFDPGTGVRGFEVFAIAVQPDGKILFGGSFTAFAGAPRPNLARLNADGTLDAGFNPATNLNEYGLVSGVTLQPDGKILFTGRGFDAANGKTPGVVGRLNPDGSADAGFQPGFSADNTVNTVAVQASGKLLLGGRFNVVNGAAHKGIARLNADGSLDAGFNANLDTPGKPNDFVYSLGLQADGKILLGGNFVTVNGVARRDIARLYGDNPHPPFFAGEAPVGNGVYFLRFPNGNNFGYYSYLPDPRYLFSFDLGYEYVFDANDGKSGVYLYDFASHGFFYTSPAFPFPYLYDFSLNAVLYYYQGTSNPRYFFNFATGQIISR